MVALVADDEPVGGEPSSRAIRAERAIRERG
jgi:hypothetical protein